MKLNADHQSEKDGRIDEVVLDNWENRPSCKHGPALLFRRKKPKNDCLFFACSAQRDGQCQPHSNQSHSVLKKEHLILEQVREIGLIYVNVMEF